MQKKYLIGNWKMYKTVEEATAFIRALLPQLEAMDTNGLALYIAPAFTHLSAMEKCISGQNAIQLLAQNCHHETEGAFTGEVSAAMLAAMDVKGVLIGHSERRIYQKEDHFVLAKKVKSVLAAGMKPFFCCGENLEERKKGNYKTVVQQQLLESLQGINREEAAKLTVAYEPVWAIGTGEVASLEVITEMHTFIREVLWEAFNDEKIPILYGGSCNPQNAKAIFGAAHVAGGLIGGTSLEAGRFMELVKLLVAQKDGKCY